MSETKKRSFDLGFVPRALGAWLLCAAALLLCAAVLFASNAAPLSRLGLGSSAISFFAALGAALAACYDRRDRWMLTGLLTAFCLIGLLLLIGFLIRGRVNGSAALSVASFTLAGCMTGALLSTTRRKNGRFRPRRGRR